MSFSSGRMADGYARARPPLHRPIMDRIRGRISGDIELAIDVGCGAGLSTEVLQLVAKGVAGIDPNVEMLRQARGIAARAQYAAARAEQLPFADACAGLITAAGSLNWADLDCAVEEARRVLSPSGWLVIYDFSTGRPTAGNWFAEFRKGLPFPPARTIDCEMLRARTMACRLVACDEFTEKLRLDEDFYVEYMMTETNVEAAISSGAAESEIRERLRTTLQPVFAGSAQDILFDGFIAYLKPR